MSVNGGGRNYRTRGSIIERGDAYAAVALAALVNALLLALLLRGINTSLRERSWESQPPAMDIVWIERTPTASMELVSVATDPAKSKRRTRFRKPLPVSPAPMATAAATEPVAASNTDVHGDSPDGLFSKRLILGGTPIVGDPLDGVSFRKPIFGSVEQGRLSPRKTDTFRMKDSSFGGLLQRMARNADCAELRAALRNRSAGGSNVDVVVRTMKERGCSS